MPAEPSDHAVEDSLRATLRHLVADVTPAGDLYAAVAGRRRRQQRVRLARASVALLVASAVGVPLGLATSQAAPRAAASVYYHRITHGSGVVGGPVMHLDSLSIRLPASYQLVAATSTPCDIGVIAFSWPTTTSPTHQAFAWQSPSFPTVQTAATADGGCVAVVLTPTGIPGSTAAPTGLIESTSASSVTVGPYRATVGVADSTSTAATPPPAELALVAQIPAGGGDDQYLIVVSQGLSSQQLVSVVSTGIQ